MQSPALALIIEDSRTQARQLGDLLTRAGYTVRVAHDGEAGLAACAEAVPAVVLCDIVMPGIDGFEVCRRLRADGRTRDVPVMLLTSLADPADVMRALAAGADNFVTKPYDADQLLARVRRLLSPARAGDMAVVEFRGQPFTIDADRGRILEVLAASLETVTARNVELERSRAAAEEALEEARRAVAARDEVIAVVSHDLRNPLNAVKMAAQLAEAESARGAGASAETLHKRMAMISRSVERMARLIGDLLDVTRIEAGGFVLERASHPVTALVDEAVQHQRVLADARQLALRAEVAPGLPGVYVDRERVLQVFANLLGNAIKFTPPGGSVTVRAERDGACVRFAVADTGSGIAPEDLPRIFDRFWQARRTARQGTGLGLPIAKGIIEGHQGAVWAESAPGVGSTIYFTLPVAPG